MTATDKKLKKLAGTIGESFAAIKRRTARSPAWLSLGSPAMKIYVELRLRWRSDKKAGWDNNGELYVSHYECEHILSLGRSSSSRGFAELQAKGLTKKTRQGDAGALPKSATTDNGGAGHSLKATTWALTDLPYKGKAATHDYEKLTWDDLRRIDRELTERFEARPGRVPVSGAKKRAVKASESGAKKQVHVSGIRNRRVPVSGTITPDKVPVSGTVEADFGHFMVPDTGIPVSTIYPGPQNGSQDQRTQRRPWHAPTYLEGPLQVFTVTFRGEASRESKNGRSADRHNRAVATLRARVFELMKTRGSGTWSPAEIHQALEIKHIPEVHRGLNELRELGLVERVRFAEYRVVGGAELPTSGSRKARNSGEAWPAPERKARGLSQYQLADLAKIKRSYLSAIEQGQRRPGPKIRAALDRALSGASIH
jgi:hypothetical protein